MLIAYRPNDGRVVWTSGVNSADPDSTRIPEQVAYAAAGSNVLFRLNDSDKRVPRLLRGEGAVIKSGAVIFDGAPPPSPSVPPELSMAEVLAMIEKLQTQSVALQEQSDLLTTMVLGGSL
jgi:hypothetical protein